MIYDIVDSIILDQIKSINYIILRYYLKLSNVVLYITTPISVLRY